MTCEMEIVALAGGTLNAVNPPRTVASAVPPSTPVVWSQARKLKLALPLKCGLGTNRIRSDTVSASSRAEPMVGVPKSVQVDPLSQRRVNVAQLAV